MIALTELDLRFFKWLEFENEFKDLNYWHVATKRPIAQTPRVRAGHIELELCEILDVS